jgi:threonine dehydratase
MKLPIFADVEDAYRRIGSYVKQTPVHTSKNLDFITNAKLFFKCENFQLAGAFKFRGAQNAISQLSKAEAARGVATHSSGNFAQALAKAALFRGISPYIVMPTNSPTVKKNAVRYYGGKIEYCKPTLADRENTLNEVINRTGAVFIHPYNNFHVIAGQGTAAYELIKEVEDLDYIICPVGGGGLLSGTLLATEGLSSKTKVIAAEPKGADDAYRSIKAGEIIPSEDPNTICDGLLTSLGTMTYPIIKKYIYDIITVDDIYTIQAMKLIWERMKIVVEPSAAITLGALLQNKGFVNCKVGLILSGGNIDLDNLPWIAKEQV